MTPPFSTLRGFAKYMRQDDQDVVAQQAMKYAFAEFFADEKPNAEGIAELEKVLEQGTRITSSPVTPEVPYKYRRFAGGAMLPRGRYFALSTGDGDDGFTLECELRSYVNHERAGKLLIKDSLASRLTPRALRYWDSELQSN